MVWLLETWPMPVPVVSVAVLFFILFCSAVPMLCCFVMRDKNSGTHTTASTHALSRVQRWKKKLRIFQYKGYYNILPVARAQKNSKKAVRGNRGTSTYSAYGNYVPELAAVGCSAASALCVPAGTGTIRYRTAHKVVPAATHNNKQNERNEVKPMSCNATPTRPQHNNN
jgi:hypothetical protein